jgi:soluble cytochrome b562
MRTLQEKYNAINEGNFTKEQFLRDVRMAQPNLVTQYNGYDDAVQILKNRGMIQEAKVDTDNLKDVLRGGKKIASGVRFVNAKDYRDGNKVGTLEKGDQVLDSEELKEARLTNKSLTDYRYKPTNDMDKYPYEQILRGLRVELEGLNVLGTPTPEEYTKALGKVLKNLEKDTIFYTNQVAGVKANAKRTDLMIDATPKNEVDKENGLKKAQLKEAKDPDIQELVLKLLKKNPSMTWTQAMKKVKEDLKDNKSQKDQLKEAIKGVIKNILSEGSEFGEGEDVADSNKGLMVIGRTQVDSNEIGDVLDELELQGEWNAREGYWMLPEDEENYDSLEKMLEQEFATRGINARFEGIFSSDDNIYEMQGPKSDDEYKSELADYLEDNQIYGYTNRIHDIMTGPDEDEAYKELAEYLDSEGIYGYNRAIERIYTDYPYDEHWMNQPDEDEADDVSHPRGYEEASDEEDFEDLFESVSLFDILDEGSSKHSTEWFKGYRAFNDDKELKDNPNKENPKKEDWKAGWEQAKSDEKKNN